MNLRDYIKSVGDSRAAELFGVEERTAASWRRGERSPRPKTAATIVSVTQGEVSFAEVYQADSAEVA